MRQRSALLQLQMVLALTLTLVLVLTLAPSGMISKKGVPHFCPSTVVQGVVVVVVLNSTTTYYVNESINQRKFIEILTNKLIYEVATTQVDQAFFMLFLTPRARTPGLL